MDHEYILNYYNIKYTKSQTLGLSLKSNWIINISDPYGGIVNGEYYSRVKLPGHTFLQRLLKALNGSVL